MEKKNWRGKLRPWDGGPPSSFEEFGFDHGIVGGNEGF
jgi:hypothetical protein